MSPPNQLVEITRKESTTWVKTTTRYLAFGSNALQESPLSGSWSNCTPAISNFGFYKTPYKITSSGICTTLVKPGD
eukprot:5496629-Pyramimonas_sp.AAC.1